MPGWVWGSDSSVNERRVGALGLGLLVAIFVADTLAPHTSLVSLLVVVPLVAALACPAPVVGALAALTFAAGIGLGAIDHIFFAERHVVGLVVILVGGLVSVAAARTHTMLIRLRDAGDSAYRRIA